MATATDPAEVVFAVHLPLLRIDADSIPFGGGDLWRMPFETFNNLTVGAFEDHADEYNATAPVFYRLVVRPELPNLKPSPEVQPNHRLQLKLPGDRWTLLSEMGFGFMESFHRLGADPAWLALLLEAPASLPPRPRWSITFAVADEGWGFHSGGHCSRIVSVQGDADLDYLMTPAFACEPLQADLIRRASTRAEQLSGQAMHPALVPALAKLAHCSSPLLSPGDQATLATIALEFLLLPEVRVGLGGTLARRLGALLDGEARQADALQQAARTLYNTRSGSVHGDEWPAGAETATRDLLGPRLLAGALIELDARCGTAGDLGTMLEAFDRKPPTRPKSAPSTADSLRDPRLPPQSPRPCQPLQLPRVSMVAMMGTNLEAPEGHYLMWAPLVGLRTTDRFALADAPAPGVMPLSGHEVMLLEERDIARDFAARVRMVEESIATLAIFLPESEVADEAAALRRMERQRDIAVAALRMAGFDTFQDPALTGSVMVRGSVRWRQPSVLRQSIWQILLAEDEQAPLIASDAARIAPHWRALREYQASPGHPDVERALSLYRRSYDHRFIDGDARAAMLFGLIEMLLGRFRPRGDAVQLEHLVARLLGPGNEAARWFADCARALRDDLAHGRGGAALNEFALAALCAIVCAALPRAIRVWLDARAQQYRPCDLLADVLSAPGAD